MLHACGALSLSLSWAWLLSVSQSHACMAHTPGFFAKNSNGEAFRPAMTIQLSKREAYPLRCSTKDELDHLICFHDSIQRILSTEQLCVHMRV